LLAIKGNYLVAPVAE